MPRYLVERTFPDGLAIPLTDAGAKACQGVITTNAEDGVTWVPASAAWRHDTSAVAYA